MIKSDVIKEKHMRTMTYPSALTPAPPRIRLDVPDGWEQLDVPHTLLAARESGRAEGEFATNVTIRHFVRPAAVTDVILIDELRDFVAGKEHGAIGEPFRRVINSHEVCGASLSYVDATAGTLGQVHVFARRTEGSRANVVQLVASFGGARAEDMRPVVRDILDSLEIDWPPREP